MPPSSFRSALLSRTGARLFLALAIAGFAAQYLHLLPTIGPPWYPVQAWLNVAAGIALFAAAIGILVPPVAERAASLLGLTLLIRFVVLHIPDVVTHLHNPSRWTGAGEILAIVARCLLAAALATAHPRLARALDRARYPLALALLLFGVLHFLYATFISQLIPAWIPQRFFFANFVGLAFVAAALAVATGVRARLAGWLLTLMFLIWVAIVHAPRVVASPHDGNEWTSMLIALAMAGVGCAIAARDPS